MAEFKIDGRMTVRTLKENFKKEFEGTLRVYDGREKAEDNATLASIRKNDDVKGGELVCRASRTVGKFEKEMLEVFGIKVQVASPDDWVLALDGITLANLKNIKKNATKADMEELVAYKRKDKDCTDDLEVGNGAIDEETSTPDLYNVEPQDGYMFLNYDFHEKGWERELAMEVAERSVDSHGEFHSYILEAIYDYNNNEPIRTAFCHNLNNGDGVYVEVKQEENDWGPGDLYCTCESKVYIVKNGKIVYSEILFKYIEESDDWFETEEEDSDC